MCTSSPNLHIDHHAHSPSDVPSWFDPASTMWKGKGSEKEQHPGKIGPVLVENCFWLSPEMFPKHPSSALSWPTKWFFSLMAGFKPQELLHNFPVPLYKMHIFFNWPVPGLDRVTPPKLIMWHTHTQKSSWLTSFGLLAGFPQEADNQYPIIFRPPGSLLSPN